MIQTIIACIRNEDGIMTFDFRKKPASTFIDVMVITCMILLEVASLGATIIGGLAIFGVFSRDIWLLLFPGVFFLALFGIWDLIILYEEEQERDS